MTTPTWKILVVDDEPDLCDLVSEEFEFAGCQTLRASSGNQALEIFEANELDAVVSDVRMADGNGIELLDKIKAGPKSSALVFLVTGFADITKEKALAKGASALIGKPYDISDLCQLVLAALEKSESAGKVKK
jgi:CheY-like chemotaxis protein